MSRSVNCVDFLTVLGLCLLLMLYACVVSFPNLFHKLDIELEFDLKINKAKPS